MKLRCAPSLRFRRLALLLALPCGLLLLLMTAPPASAQSFDYRLQPRRVAEGVQVFEGRLEHFSRENGGNILNTGFIETQAGAVVIDSGPSRRYGEQQRAAIARLAGGKPIARVFITHAHPDHFLGNQAYADVPVAALPGTLQAIQQSGEALAANLYRLVGGWMEGTEPRVPNLEAAPGELEIGGRRLRLIALAGHSGADLAVYDLQTRTLFAGDLAFFQRAATTPDADLATWLAAIDVLAALDFQRLVPGHGPVVEGAEALAQTRAYLRWLRDSLQQSAARGLDMNEVRQIAVPAEFARLAVFREEFDRSVVHLYPTLELDTLRRAPP